MPRTQLGWACAVAAVVAASTGCRTPAPPPVTATVLFTDVLSGPVVGGPENLGVPITIYGTGFGSRRDTSKVTIGGVEVARYVLWESGTSANTELDTIVVQPGSAVRGGQIAVTIGGVTAPGDAGFARNDQARIFEVGPRGSDSASCRWGDPCVSIQRVAGLMNPGDTALVRAGTSSESEIWIRGDQAMSGTASDPVNIVAAPGERPVLANPARPFIVDADYITVAGLTFEDGKSLGIPDTGLPGHRGNRLLANRFTGEIAWAAIDSHGDDHLIAGNHCSVSGSSVGTQGHCYYVSYGSGVAVRYNVGEGAPGYGIHVFDQQRSSSDFRRVISGLLIEGNVLRNSTQRSGLIVAMNDEGGRGNLIEDVTVRGNRFEGNEHLGMVIAGLVRDMTITGNTFSDNGRQGLHVGVGVTGVSARANTFVQAANGVCSSNCSWYRLAHVEVEPGAVVDLDANTYRPGPPLAFGVVDAHPLG